jgi:hypothetical protein
MLQQNILGYLSMANLASLGVRVNQWLVFPPNVNDFPLAFRPNVTFCVEPAGGGGGGSGKRKVR